MDELRQRVVDLSPAKRAILELQLERNRARAVTYEIPPRSEPTSAPASFAQERLWLLNQLEPNQSVYNISRVVHLSGPLVVGALELALREIVNRHEALRTRFDWVGESLRQIIDERHNITLSVIDLTELSKNQRAETAKLLTTEESERPFNLSTGPTFRTTLLRLDDDEHILSLVTHHIVSDAWSAAILFDELEQLYRAFTNGNTSSLQPLTIQYPDFAEWQRNKLRGSTLALQLSYWKEKLAGAPLVLDVPTDRPSPAVQTFRGAHCSLNLSRSLSKQLTDLSRGEDATLFMTLLAAFKILLCRYSRQYDILVGSPISGRNTPEIEGLIGFFVNTLVLRTDLSRNPTFKELLAQVRDTALEAYEHQDLPFEKLVEELHPQRDLGRNPIFQVMFQLQNAPRATRTLKGIAVRTIQLEKQSAKFALFLTASEIEGALRLSMEYSTDLFDAATIDRMLRHYENLLKGIVADPDVRVSQAQLLTDSERQQIVFDWNNTRAEFPEYRSLHRMFEEQVNKDPGRVAFICGNQQLTYGELNVRANQLAHYLLELGVKPETLVGIYLNRSLEMVIGLLSVLKAGGAYVPLDPSYPRERVAFMIKDANLPVILTNSTLLKELPSNRGKVVALDAEWETIQRNSGQNTIGESSPDSLAYVFYTSGSTGTPKGVLGLHGATINRFQWMWQQYPFAAGEVCCQKTSLSFADSIWEIFGPLLQGVPNVILSDEVVKDPHHFIESLSANNVSRIVLVPSLLRLVLEEGKEIDQRLSRLKYWVCSGEALPIELADNFRLKVPNSLLINLYGSSEVAADVSCYEVRNLANLSSIPIGHPIANTQIYILDSNLQPVPIGIPGELCVGGASLARGYLDRPGLTAEKFIPNPFSDGCHTRLYRTGDLARRLADGTIEYLGRIDRQIKIRGFRVELGEIETVLMRHPQLQHAAVVEREGANGERKLTAYVVAQGDKVRLGRELRKFLKKYLPEYMVPAAFVLVDELPLTPSGKINRQALLLIKGEESETTELYVAPRTPVEKKLAEIWSAILQRERIGIHDNFFNLGGHSMLAAKLMAEIEKVFSQRIPLVSLFQGSTIEYLAGLLMQDVASMSWPTLVEIQAGDSKPPLFCISNPNVNALGYRTLARYLGPNQPVFGLQAQYPEAPHGEYSREVVDRLATEYLQSLRAVRPTGPYQFVGICRGAHIAFEMARRLEHEGQQVALLGILDTWVMENTYNIFFYLNHYANRLRWLTQLGFRNQLSFIKKKAQGALMNFGGKISTRESVNGTKRKRNPLHEIYFPGPDFVPRTYNGRVAVFRARRQPWGRIRDFSLGWNRLALGGADVHFISGPHTSVLKEPYVQSLATELKKCLLG